MLSTCYPPGIRDCNDWQFDQRRRQNFKPRGPQEILVAHKDMASAGVRAYNGGEPLVRGSGGEAPQKLKAFLFLDVS